MYHLSEAFKAKYRYGYHRTAAQNVPSIVDRGFIPGYGDMYGRGFYMCFDLESQFNPSMTSYGDIILKSEIFDKGVLIFDYNISKEVYGSNYTILKQLVKMGVARSEVDLDQYWWSLSKACEKTLENEKVSAELAFQSFVCGADPIAVIEGRARRGDGWSGNPNSMLNSSTGTPNEKKITAIMFSGNHDGNVIVVYNANTAKPVQYVLCDKNVLNAGVTARTIKWEPIGDFEKASKRSENLRMAYDLFASNIENLEIDLDNINVNLFKKKYDWLIKCQTRNANIKIDKDGNVEFLGGTWIQGDFNGSKFNGEFQGGKFSSGVFEGNWKFGVFQGGTFNGTWNRGSWKGGTWGPGAYKRGNDEITYFLPNGDMEMSNETPDKFLANK